MAPHHTSPFTHHDELSLDVACKNRPCRPGRSLCGLVLGLKRFLQKLWRRRKLRLIRRTGQSSRTSCCAILSSTCLNHISSSIDKTRGLAAVDFHVESSMHPSNDNIIGPSLQHSSPLHQPLHTSNKAALCQYGLDGRPCLSSRKILHHNSFDAHSVASHSAQSVPHMESGKRKNATLSRYIDVRTQEGQFYMSRLNMRRMQSMPSSQSRSSRGTMDVAKVKNLCQRQCYKQELCQLQSVQNIDPTSNHIVKSFLGPSLQPLTKKFSSSNVGSSVAGKCDKCIILANANGCLKGGGCFTAHSYEKQIRVVVDQLVHAAKDDCAEEDFVLAAEKVRRICKNDVAARVCFARLGVISPLVSTLDSALPHHQHAAILALLNLAVGNDKNKEDIVRHKAVPKLVRLLNSPYDEVRSAVVATFLSLSALEGNKFVIGASGAVWMLVKFLMLQCQGNQQLRSDALRTLYNLSLHSGNIKPMAEAASVPRLLALMEDVEMREKSLATLSNFSGMDIGRHAIVLHKEKAFHALINVIHWAEAPKCQEKAVYILMKIAQHGQHQEREMMLAAGVIPVLVELSLLGSPLAQKRALQAMDSFRDGISYPAPLQVKLMKSGHPSSMSSCSSMIWERRVVENLVQQSLRCTLERITKRANGAGGPGGMYGAHISSYGSSAASGCNGIKPDSSTGCAADVADLQRWTF